MHCPNCKTEIPDGAHFCPACGLSQIKSNDQSQDGGRGQSHASAPQPQGTQPQPQGTPPQQQFAPPQQQVAPPQPSNMPPQQPKPKKRWPLVVGICAAVLLVAVAGIAAFTFVLRNVSGKATQECDIVFTISIGQGYDTSASRIPVSIKGTDVNGNAVDKTVFLAYEGVDTQLPPGSYEVSAIGSPIAKDGTIYTYPDKPYKFTVDPKAEGNKTGSGRPTIAVASQNALAYTPVSPEKMTDKAIDDALAWARKDEDSRADVGQLEKATKARKNKGSAHALWLSPRFFADAMSRTCTLQQFANMAVL